MFTGLHWQFEDIRGRRRAFGWCTACSTPRARHQLPRFQLPAVEAQLHDLSGKRGAATEAFAATTHAHVNLVFAVDWKDIVDRQPAACAERHAIKASILSNAFRHFERLHTGR